MHKSTSSSSEESQALTVKFRDTQIRVCSLDHLRAMKRAAGRPQDLEDLEHLNGA